MRQTHELPESVNFSGIILTSQNAVEALTKFDKGNVDTDRWAKLPIFAVGPATAVAAQDVISEYNQRYWWWSWSAGTDTLLFFRKIGEEANDKSSNKKLPLFWPSAVEISFDMVAAWPHMVFQFSAYLSIR